MQKSEKKRPHLEGRTTAEGRADGRAAEVYRTAAKMILQKGYDGTSVSDIADALGITKAGLYHYISGKTELLYEIMKFGLEELDQQVIAPAQAIADAEERLRFVIRSHAKLVMDGEGAVTILVDEARALSPAQNRKVTKLKRAYFELIRGTLEQLQREGKLRDVDTTVAAFSVMAAINWTSRWYQSEGSLTAEQVAEHITELAFHGALKSDERSRKLRPI